MVAPWSELGLRCGNLLSMSFEDLLSRHDTFDGLGNASPVVLSLEDQLNEI